MKIWDTWKIWKYGKYGKYEKYGKYGTYAKSSNTPSKCVTELNIEKYLLKPILSHNYPHYQNALIGIIILTLNSSLALFPDEIELDFILNHINCLYHLVLFDWVMVNTILKNETHSARGEFAFDPHHNNNLLLNDLKDSLNVNKSNYYIGLPCSDWKFINNYMYH